MNSQHDLIAEIAKEFKQIYCKFNCQFHVKTGHRWICMDGIANLSVNNKQWKLICFESWLLLGWNMSFYCAQFILRAALQLCFVCAYFLHISECSIDMHFARIGLKLSQFHLA